MHTKPMAETDGDFTAEHWSKRPCRKCGKFNVSYRVWESSCGGYEDAKEYTCRDCTSTWWGAGRMTMRMSERTGVIVVVYVMCLVGVIGSFALAVIDRATLVLERNECRRIVDMLTNTAEVQRR